MISTYRLAAITLAFSSFPLALHATDPTLDSAFVTAISPGLTPDGYVPPPAAPNWLSGTGAVNAVALQSDGKIIAGGNVSRYQAPPAGSPQTSLKRLNSDGTLDTAFGAIASTLADTQGDTEVNKILTVANDKLYVGGVFTSYDGTARGGIMRLNADGSLDHSFAAAGISNSSTFGMRYVLAIAEQPDGKVLVGGGYNRANGTSRPGLARFNSNGSLDTSFNPSPALPTDTSAQDIALLPNGQILVAGGKPRAGGGYVPLLVRLNADGTQDSSLAPAFADTYGDIDELLVLPDGRILIGGDFAFLPTGTEYNIACLQPDGSLDTAFMSNLGSGPNGWTGGELVLQPDGTILVGGVFTLWNNQPRASIARLQPDGSLDAALAMTPYLASAALGYMSHFYSFAVQPDGKLLVGGWFARVTDTAVESYNLTRIVNEYAPGEPGTLRLVSTQVSTTENAGSVTLQVSRFGGLTGPVTVNFSTLTGGSLNADGTATAGVDFTSASGALSWAAGEGGFKTITVPVLTDATADGAKTFTVALTGVTGGAFLPSPAARATVTIRDADALPTVTAQPASVSLEQGAAFSLSVRYDSVLAATVQWQRDPDGAGPLPFADIPGATSPTYTVTNADAATRSGPYRAVLTNLNGVTNSATATVSISVPAGSIVTAFVPPSTTPIVTGIQGLSMDPAGRFLMLSSTGLRRLNTDGTLDPTTSFGISVSGATCVLGLDDGKILIAGNLSTPFTHQPSGATSSVNSRIFRLNADATSTIDTSWSVSTNGVVTALAPGASGKFYVGSAYAPTTTNGIQRFLATGAVDSSWTPAVNTIAAGTNGTAIYIKELADGKVLVSHRHGSSGSSSYRLSRLTSTGALDTTFGTSGSIDIGISNYVSSIDVLPDGRIAVTGRFNVDFFTTGQRYLAILNADGTLDPSFQFGSTVLNNIPNGVLYRDGRLFVWGAFTTINGTTQAGVVRLNLDGSVDSTFSAGVGIAGGAASVNAARFTSTGEIFIAGGFTSYKGVARNYSALLVGNPQIGAIGFAPPRVSLIEGNTSLTLTLRRYGAFTEAASIAWATADGTAVSGSDYTAASGTVAWAAGDNADKTINIPLLDDSAIESSESFTVALSAPSGPVGPAASATVTLIDSDTPVTFSAQPAGSALLTGGNLSLTATATSPSPVTYQWFRNGIALSGATAASLGKSGVTAADAGVYTLVATNASGSYTTAPVFVGVRPQPGSRYPGYAPNQASFTASQIRTIIPLANGGAYIGGGFPNVSADNTYRYFARVNADLSLDTTFLPFPNNPNNTVNVALRQPDGKILVGGDFTQWAGQNINRLVRLNSDGSLDTAFNTALGTGPAASVQALALLPDGRIVVGGSFTGYQGDNYLTVLLSTGAPDSSFTSTASNGAVTKLAVRDVGGQTRILAGGNFTNFSGANRLVLLNTDGTRDTTFTNAVTGSTGTINDLLVLADGRMLAAGSFGAFEVSLTGSSASNLGSSVQTYDFAEAPGGSIIGARTSTTSSLRLFRLKGTNPFPVPGSNDTDTVFGSGIGSGPDTDPSAVAVGSDGVVWVGGLFSSFNGVSAGGLVKLYGDPINPSVINPPANFGVAPGGTATFGVGAYGTGLAYQWLKDGVPLANGDDISGATTALLSIANADLSDQADYTVQVTGGSPSTTVTSSAGHLYVLGAPVVPAPPAPVDIFAGPALTFSAEVFAAAPATYQWTRDGIPVVNDARISGATTAALAFASTLASDTGTYALTVSNAQGSATTSVFVLVRPVPTERATAFSGLSSSQSVTALHALPDGGMLVATLNGTLTNHSFTDLPSGLHIVKPDGSVANLGLDPALGTGLPALSGLQVTALLRQPDGKILVGGAGGYLGRYHADGSLDTSFAIGNGSTGGQVVRTLAFDDAGRLLVGGDFLNYKGVAGQNLLVRLDAATGALDTSFASGFSSGSVTRILKLPGANSGFIVGGINIANPYTVNIRRYDASGANVASFIGQSYAVNTLALTPDGTAFYAAIQGAPYLARYRVSDGSLDPAFNVPTGTFNNQVHSLVVQHDGKVVAHGQFNIYPQTQIGRILTNGAPDPTFLVGGTNYNYTHFPLALDTAGRIWLGGVFTNFNNATANRIAVLEGDVPALAWIAQPLPRSVTAGETIAFSASVRSTTAVTYQWYKNDSPLADGGRVSGATSAALSITGATVADEGLYTLRATTTAAGSIDSIPAELVFLAAPEITAMPAGRTAPAGSAFTATATARGAGTLSYQWLRGGTPVSGQTARVLSLAAPATTDTGWYQLRVTNTLGTATSEPVLFVFAQYAGSLAGGMAVPSVNSNINALSILADGGAIIAGPFNQITPLGGTAQNAFGTARLTPTGTLFSPAPQVHSFYSSFGTLYSGTSSATTRDSQGRIIVAGNFDGVSSGGTGAVRNSLARFNADGTLDTTWNSPLTAALNTITCLAVDSSDNIYVGGSFTSINSVANTRSLVRLSAATGALDTAFVSPFTTTGTVNRILILSDGRLLVGGTVGIRLLETTGALASGFSYTAGGSVNTLAALPSGDFLVGTTTGLQRITSAGTLVSPFPATGTAANGAVRAIVPLSGDRFAIAGNFTAYNSVTVGRIAVINADGTVNTSIPFGTGFTDGQVNALALDPQNRLWVGGLFTTYNGATVGRLAVLATTNFTPDTPAPPSSDLLDDFLATANVPANLRGPNNDADGDGLDNLLEYALDLNPFGNGGAYSGTPPTSQQTPTQLSFTYRRVRNDVTYVVETSSTLTGGTWTNVGVTQGTPDGNGTTTASIPVTPGSQFLRLSVTR